MIDGLIFAAIIIIWDILRSLVIAPFKIDKKIGKRIERLETRMDKVDVKIDKILKKLEIK